MKASRFSDAQKASILRQGNDGVQWRTSAGRPESARRPISTWKKKWEGIQPLEMRRLK